MDALPLLSAQYCARKDATAFLELWALTSVLCGGAVWALGSAKRLEPPGRSAARFCAGALLCSALLTCVVAGSMFYGCSATAANEQGLPSALPAARYTLLRCLGSAVPGMATGWVLLVITIVAATLSFVFGRLRVRRAARGSLFAAAAVLLAVAFTCGFFLYFAFSWCTSERLI